jgi:L-threonylcarbamoyladenylate synthase
MVRLSVSSASPEPEALAGAAAVVARGGIVGFPTDTLYGLAADPRNPEAVARVFEVKGRAAGEALPLIAADLAQVEKAAGRLPRLARRLAARFWPGPLTLVIDAAPAIAPAVHGGTGTMAIRVPDHPVARGLASAVGFPITSTSANPAGEPAPSRADDVALLLGARLDLLLDGGPTPGGLPSTIVDARSERPRLVRAGAIPFARVLESLA